MDTKKNKTSESWWNGQYTNIKIEPRPALDPKTGDLLGYAVCVVTTDTDLVVGIIAVCTPSRPAAGKPPEMGRARWAAKGVVESRGEFLDNWMRLPETQGVADYRHAPPLAPLHHRDRGLHFKGDKQYDDDGELDLVQETFRIAEHLWAARPALDPLCILFEMALRSEQDDEPSDPVALAHARAAFFQLAADERRKIFNGWDYDQEFPTTHEVKKIVNDYAAPVLSLGIERGATAPLKAHLQWAASDVFEREPVKIEVLAGTPKAQAIAALRAGVKYIEREWDKIIVDPAEAVPAVDKIHRAAKRTKASRKGRAVR